MKKIDWKFAFGLPVHRYVCVLDECTTVCAPWRGKLGAAVADYARTYDISEEDGDGGFTLPECTAFLVVDGRKTERMDFRIGRTGRAERI